MKTGYQLLAQVLDLIFPIRCLECGRFKTPTDAPYLCRRCAANIVVKSGSECIGCKQPSSLGLTCPTCKDSQSIDRLLVATDYSAPLIQKLLKTLKYRFVPDIAEPLGFLLQKYITALVRDKKFNIFSYNPPLIPVPISRRRFLWRGFNQSELLAACLAVRYGQAICTTALARVGNAAPQADIRERKARLANVVGNFRITDPTLFQGRTVLLIDDVCTTGATLSECARLLKEGGATSVTALVVARG